MPGETTLAYDERYHFRPDPVVHFEVPQDGDYIVEIHDSIFRGREDFVYRLTIGELPFVTGIFPLGGRLGEKTTVALTGWNLPEKSLLHDNSVEGDHFAWKENFSIPFRLPWTICRKFPRANRITPPKPRRP